MKILLGSKQNINSKDTTMQVKFNLTNKYKLFGENSLGRVIDETELSHSERNACTKYLLYGKVEPLIDSSISNSELYRFDSNNYKFSIGYSGTYQPIESAKLTIIEYTNDSIIIENTNQIILNDIIMLYFTNEEFLIRKVIDISINDENIELIFDREIDINLSYKLIPSSAQYDVKFSTIIDSDFLKLYDSGFSVNIFGDVIKQFHTYKNIDVNNLIDNLGLPITDLYLRIEPIQIYTNHFKDDYSVEQTNDVIKRIQIDLNELTFIDLNKTVSVINNDDILFNLTSYYNFKIRVFSDALTIGNVDSLFNYPDYAFVFNDNSVVFRDLLDIGVFEDELGVDYPFVNNQHYLFNDIKFLIRRNIPLTTYTNNVINDVYDTELVDPTVKNNRIC